ncbi:MAG TPA: right-handed parallel beta-helix repeat-containing protein, partial [Dehalococcoidia bacterium]|nr:right-handed parallel beta-helix repeat-containing protein [Dehalococcoidia bacterium]
MLVLMFAAGALLLLLAQGQPGHAQVTFTVNSTADVVDAAPGNGACETAPGNGVCTLRAGIQEANALFGGDTIDFDPGVFSGPRTISLIYNPYSLPPIAEDLDIQGPPPTDPLTIDANLTVRTVFYINSGVRAKISDLTAQRGAGLYPYSGGGIHNLGNVTLTNVTIKNSVTPAGYGDYGGGIYNYGGTVTLYGSTVSGNIAVSTCGNCGSFGGGIYNHGGTVILNDSTVSGNYARQGAGIFSESGGAVTLNDSTVSGNSPDCCTGGIYFNGGTLTINNSTLSGNRGSNIYLISGTLTLNDSTVSNSSGNGGLGIASFGGPVKLKNTIVANNQPDCFGGTWQVITSFGHNLDSDGSCGLSAANGDLPNTNPYLVPLALNPPGSTKTHALCTGPGLPDPSSCGDRSPAIDAVPVADCTDTAGTPITAD